MTTIPNTHKVGRDQWRKWNQQQRALFNGTFEDITRIGPEHFVHPVTFQRGLSDSEFETIAWNAAWVAAHMLLKHFTAEVHTVYRGKVIAVDKISQRASKAA